MYAVFTVIRSAAASALTFIEKVRLKRFRNTIFKCKIIVESVNCLKNDFKFIEFQAFTNTSVQSLFPNFILNLKHFRKIFTKMLFPQNLLTNVYQNLLIIYLFKNLFLPPF